MKFNSNETIANGIQLILANDNSKVNPIQINSSEEGELEKIIKGIKDESAGLKEEDAESINHVVDMVKKELRKSKPKVSRLKNCLASIDSMLAIANGIPVLGENLQKLADYVTQYIK